MPSAFFRLLVELAEDPLRAQAFQANPESAMAGRDLTEEEKQALLSRDPARIRVLLTEELPDRNWLLLAWFGSLSADDEGAAS